MKRLGVGIYDRIIITNLLTEGGKASSQPLDFQRIDYPQLDPPEWAKFLTVSLDNGKVKVGERPLGYAGNLKENYEARNKEYQGVYKG